MVSMRLFCCIVLASTVASVRNNVRTSTTANPIRKVVSLLQAMQKKVAEEGEKEKELYEKFKCYCQTSGGDLSASISSAETKVPAVGSDIGEAESQKTQLQEDLKSHQADRDDAKKAMTSATQIREKEAAAYAAEKSEVSANIDAITSAVSALEKGMAGGFLQTSNAQVLRRVAMARDMQDSDRQEILAFLSGGQGSSYVPQSGEITGILKEIRDDMTKSLAEATTSEKEAVQIYDSLMAAKTKEVGSLTASIESKMERVGELGVHIVQLKNDLSDTQAQLLEDKKFLANLDTACADKSKEYDERVKVRSEELAALADTIRVLNDDDALELFKKTLPSASASFLQVSDSPARKALELLAKVRKDSKDPHLDFIALALRGKQAGFDKVIGMIDGMVLTLKKEQTDDDSKKEYCGVQMDQAEDSHKKLERDVSDAETAISNAKEGIATAAEEIAALERGIKALDASVAEATQQRKEEHAEFTSLLASDSAAKELLHFAKNRLNKFYQKALYKPSPERELSEEDRIAVNLGGAAPPTEAPGGIAGTGISALQRKQEPPPTFSGAYKKSGDSTGVIAMIDLLVKDLDKEMTEAKAEEKNSQAEYETAMADSAAKRAQDSKTLTEKTALKAELEGNLQAHSADKAAAGKELMATGEYIASLHAECDWLLQYYDVRKEARAGEIDSLRNAKAVLKGADYAL